MPATKPPAPPEIEDDYLDPLLIKGQYMRLPALYAYHNGRYADALEAHLRAELERKRTEARLAIQIRKTAQLTGSKATESAIREAIDNSDEWAEVCMAEIDTQVALARERGEVERLRIQKDMLVSLGAHVRQELDANPFAREQSRESAFARRNNGGDFDSDR